MKCFINGNVGADHCVRPRWHDCSGRHGGLPLQILCLLLAQGVYACPLCKDALTEGMAKGFFWSIILMLTVPAVVVGVIAGVIWRAERRKLSLPDAPRG